MQALIRGQFSLVEGSKRARNVSILAVVAVLLGTLWPLNPFPRNKVTWLPGTNGLNFKTPSLVIGKGLISPETGGSQSYTLELLVQPATVRPTRTILAFYDGTHSKELLVRQVKDGLLVLQAPAVETAANEFYVPELFRVGRPVLIAISSGSNGTTVYVDGHPARRFPEFKISRTDLSDEIVIGSSAVDYQPWNGEMKGFAIYAKELTREEAVQHYSDWTDGKSNSLADLDAAIAHYTFQEGTGTEIHNQTSGPSLRIPSVFSVPHKSLLESPAEEFRPTWKYTYELVTNIAGFVPLGLVICCYLLWTGTRWNAVLVTTFFCGMLSFTIEVLQYYIPRRGSGVTDIITNTLGAAVGAVLVYSKPLSKCGRKIGLIPESELTIAGRTTNTSKLN